MRRILFVALTVSALLSATDGRFVLLAIVALLALLITLL